MTDENIALNYVAASCAASAGKLANNACNVLVVE